MSFPPTPWSLILCIQKGSIGDRRRALETLCRCYWQPLYVYARLLGWGREDAEDLTQMFFGQLHESQLWERAAQDKGRLRSFLAGAFRRLMIDERRKRSSLKRGGGLAHVPLDQGVGEDLYLEDRAAGRPPDAAYEYRWALQVFTGALQETHADYTARGKQALYMALQPFLMAESHTSLQELAHGLGMTDTAIRTALHRIRRRFREHFRQAVAVTLTGEDNLDEEMRYILNVLRTGGVK